MRKFLKENVFFLIDKEEKEYIKQNVMNRDHKMLCLIICVIGLFELIVLIFFLINNELDVSKPENIATLILYIGLIIACSTSLVFWKFQRKKEKTFQYFFIASIYLINLLILFLLR